MLKGQKTYLLAAAAFVAAIFAYLSGDANLETTIRACFDAVMFGTLRAGLNGTSPFTGYKTYITAAVACITALSQWAVGSTGLEPALQACLDALVFAALRGGIAKTI